MAQRFHNYRRLRNIWHHVLAHLSWKVKRAFLIALLPSSVRPSVRKHFTFSPSSPEPLSQFLPNLAQNILGWRRFNFFFQIKGHTLFQSEIIRNSKNILTKFWNLLFPNHWVYFNQIWHKACILWWRGRKFIQMKDHALFQGEKLRNSWKYIGEKSSEEPQNHSILKNFFLFLINDIIYYWFELFSPLSDVARGPLVFLYIDFNA